MAFEGILEVHSAKYAGKTCLMVGQVTRGFPDRVALRCSSTVNRNLDTEEANAAGGGLDVYIRPIPAVYFLVKRQIL